MKTNFLFLAFIATFFCYAQQDSQYTQYMYNTQVFNPAYIGSNDYLKAILLHRNQWVGLKGAPLTNTLSVSAPVGKNLSLGLSVFNDRIGPQDESSLAVDFGYNLKLNDVYQLALGLKLSGSLLNVDYSKLDIYDNTDQDFAHNIVNKFYPNIGAGAFLYSDHSYIGLSIPALLEVSHIDEYNSSLAKEKMHIYLTGGYVFNLSDNLKLKPAVLMKYVYSAPFIFDFSANSLFMEKFTLGVSYRTSKTFSALAGFQISPQWMIGYAYDSEVGKLSNYNSGSHELFIKFDLGQKETKKLLTPRFF